jgi:opacity protein-like surface antigen
MYMKSLARTMVTAALLSASAIAQDSQSTSPAEAAASAWLALVDAGRYSDSWDQAAGLFKSKISAPSWASAIGGVRGPLGALKSRRIQSSTFTHTLPGVPDGNYVVITYSSRFDNKAEAVETVTPSQEKDGTWHVSGYFVK